MPARATHKRVLLVAILASSAPTIASPAASASTAIWLNCLEGDVALVTAGLDNADPERASQGYVCRQPGEVTGAAGPRTYLRAWIGSFTNDREKNTFGLTDGDGLRDGDTDE